MPGDAAAGRAILSGVFRFAGEETDATSLDFAEPGRAAAFADYLQSFAFLPDLAAAGPRRR